MRKIGSYLIDNDVLLRDDVTAGWRRVKTATNGLSSPERGETMVRQIQSDECRDKKEIDSSKKELREKEVISEAIEAALCLIQGLKNSTN